MRGHAGGDDRRAVQGFSLVEALIGLTVLIVGFLPVYLLIAGGEKSSVETVRSVQASMHAHALLEEVAHLPYGRIAPAPRSADADYLAALSRDKSLEGWFSVPPPAVAESFDRSVEVIAGEGFKRIKVYVVDRAVARGSGGGRGELLLETMVVR